MLTPSLAVGARIGRIRIEGVLGAGGMGEVYRGFDEGLRRRVAVKCLRAERALGPEARARFMREARLLSQLDHPAICRVHDLVVADDAEFLVLELVEGRTLRQALRERALGDRAVAVAEAVADALAAAHRQGIVHRDLKPENIMLTPDGAVKVLDFGIARSLADDAAGWPAPAPGAAGPVAAADTPETTPWELSGAVAGGAAPPGVTFATLQGTVVGTARYMSPEQARGAPVGAASDLFALGVVLQEMLTGRDPYAGAAGPDLFARVLRGELEPPGPLPRELGLLIRDLTRPDPRARPSAEETRRRLQRERERPGRVRRRVVAGTLAAGAVTALAVAAVVAVGARVQARRQVELVQRFALEVQDAESLLWRHQSLPLHDVRAARSAMRARLEAIAATARAVGAVAAAPAHAAQGRGLVALGEHEQARRHLEQAWSAGMRTPETAFALGAAYGGLYEEALGEASLIGDDAARAARRRAAETDLRDPALGYLRAARGAAGVVPEHAEARIALLEGRLEDAVALARAAAEKAPWLYDARVLEGSALARLADDGWWAGRYEEAVRWSEAAGEALREALRIGESDPQAHEGLCRLLGRSFHHAVWNLGEPADELFERAERACRDGLVADPDRVSLLCELSDVLADRAESLSGRGQDAMAALRASREPLEHAIALDPGGARALVGLAERCWLEGKLAMPSGGDPRPAFASGLGWARQALAGSPGYGDALQVQGGILLDQGVYEDWIGTDPRGSLLAAAEAFRQEGERSPEQLTPTVNRGMAVYLLARHLVRWRGADPGALPAEAVAALERVLERNPRMSWAHRTLGAILGLVAEREVLTGGDAEPAVERALHHLRQAAALKPRDVNTRIFTAEAELAGAEGRVDRGLDPGGRLAAARQALAAGEALIPGLSQLLKLRAATERVEARWAVARGRSPTAALARAATWATRAAAADPNDQEAHALSVDIELAALEARALGSPSRSSDLAAARAALGAAEQRAPGLWWLPLARGRLLLLEARAAAGDAARRRHLAAGAIAALESACQDRPGVALRHAGPLAAARRLAAD